MSTVAIQAAARTGLELGVRVGAQVALSHAQSAITRAFDDRRFTGPRLEQFRVMSSTDGAPLPRVMGRARVGGQVIWASNIRETETEEKVGKGGGPTSVTYSYTISFAVALCEGEIAGIDRIWANGDVLPTRDITVRVHRGTADQLPDPVIAAVEGDAPAYRGTAYIVFEDFPLDTYGTRLPQINVEVVRPVSRQDRTPRLEDLVTGVNLLPGSGEFAYATSVAEDRGLPGGARPVNVNSHAGVADATAALDQLERDLPNCKSVSIISSWFGTDLRLGSCEVRPGVETRDRFVVTEDWKVAGLTRATAPLVGRDADGNPVYGATPSDHSLVELITELKARGFEVALYPFILMDIAPGNGLPDPYGGSEQAAYPWRGRITTTGDAATEARGFFGDCEAADFVQGAEGLTYSGPEAFSFRRFILHHAAVARAAGGVDRFVIGSEMREMTTSTDGDSYPAVDELIDLAAEVRAILPGALLTYAADWSEYSGHHSPSGLRHHLDPLWADANIDLIAIDAYFPLSDWREGDWREGDWREGEHLDAQRFERVHDLAYLASNVEGGEGYDWYYADAEARASQTRTPILQPRFRYKDVRHFWESEHMDDRGPTPWVPRSKPVWFSEIGCPAVDLGSNQPNVFVDPKSSESVLPYGSSGRRDDLIQRLYLRAFIDHYSDDPMIDGMHVWCWDARPFPDFPARTSVWSDGPNWQLGHWLSGRMGRVALADIIADVCAELDVETDVSAVSGMVEGFVLDRPMSARSALENLCAAFGIDVVDAPGKLVFSSREARAATPVTPDMRADSPVTLTHAPDDAVPGDVRLRFVDSARDHQPGLASGARRIGARNPTEVALPVVMDEGLAERLAGDLLARVQGGQVEANLQLSPASGVSVGEVIRLPGSDADFLVTALDGPTREGVACRALSLPDSPLRLTNGGALPTVTAPVPWSPEPALFAFNFPDREGLAVGVMRDPFAPVRVSAGEADVVLGSPVRIGWLAEALGPSTPGLIDEQSVTVAGLTARLDSVDGAGLLSGLAHRFAVETNDGWEIVSARDAELIGEGEYRLGGFLRGLHGTEHGAALPAGTRVVHLSSGVKTLPLDGAAIDVEITAEVGGRSAIITESYSATRLRPWSPVHLSAVREGGDIRASWTRRTRAADNWQGLDVPLAEEREVYRVELLRAGDVVASQEVTQANAEIADVEDADAVRVRQGSVVWGWGRAGECGII